MIIPPTYITMQISVYMYLTLLLTETLILTISFKFKHYGELFPKTYLSNRSQRKVKHDNKIWFHQQELATAQFTV